MFQRIVSFLAAALFGSLLLIGVFLIWLQWHVFITFIGAIPTGIQGEQFLRLWMAYGQQATGFIDFINRMKIAYNSAKSDSTKTENDSKS